jgi:hypothetical protein
MSACTCGVDRRQFWLWRDGNGVLHASRFAPTNGEERSVFAATARDALWAGTDGRQPKHDVNDAADGSRVWTGRCGGPVTAEAVSVT